jgi:hypothetical protein
MPRSVAHGVRVLGNFALKSAGGKADVVAVSETNDSRHYVRRVVLPSGKTIEVVYFEEHPAVSGGTTAAPSAPRPGVSDVTDLHVCGTCRSDLVYPLEWEEAGTTHWEVTLRCPNCEWCGTGIFEQSVVERFDEELDRGTEALVGDLRRLVAANMEDEIERFVQALDNDVLLPEDF